MIENLKTVKVKTASNHNFLFESKIFLARIQVLISARA